VEAGVSLHSKQVFLSCGSALQHELSPLTHEPHLRRHQDPTAPRLCSHLLSLRWSAFQVRFCTSSIHASDLPLAFLARFGVTDHRYDDEGSFPFTSQPGIDLLVRRKSSQGSEWHNLLNTPEPNCFLLHRYLLPVSKLFRLHVSCSLLCMFGRQQFEALQLHSSSNI
jgi:hypothetical protein